jgi:polyketide cyclase/dehydrase/lipid transport protein
MPSARLHVDAAPERVWTVLADPRAYAVWVVGARAVHESDAAWPAAGATLRHSQGRAPLILSDTTTVVASEPPRLLELEARVRPLLVSRVLLRLERDGEGTLVRLEERPAGGILDPLLRLPPWVQLLAARNRASLRRLRWAAEVGGRTHEGASVSPTRS